MKQVGRRWLGAAIFGTILMALGSLLIVGIQAQTRGSMRDILEVSGGEIQSDGQFQALQEVMTRGLMLSLGGFGMVVLGVVLGIMGLAGFFILRRKARKESPAVVGMED